MRSTRQIILAAELEPDDRPPRIIAPLQHIFDPIVGVAQHHVGPRWGDSYVPGNRFSDRPRIVFDRLPAIPAEFFEGMLYLLQRRLMTEVLLSSAHASGGGGIDRLVTMLPA